jgi:translocation and assembly module TamB
MAAQTPKPSTPKPAPRRSWAATVALVLGPAVAGAAIVAGTAWWIATTPGGLRAAATVASAVVPGLEITGVEGSMTRGLSIASFSMTRSRWSIRIDQLSLEPRHWSAWTGELDVERLAARRIQVEWAHSDAPSNPLTSLALPLDLIVRQGNVQELTLGARGAKPVVFRRIELSGRMDEQAIELAQISAEFERTQLEARGRIEARPPFATQAEARLTTRVRERPVTADVSAGGSLQQLALKALSNDASTHLQVDATLRLFDRVPLERLTARIESLDPAHWLEGVPSMQLRARAELEPVALADGTWSVAGPFSGENSSPGPLDRDRLPLRAVRGRLVWAADILKLSIERAEGVRGTATGTVTWSSAAGVHAEADFKGIDASTLQSQAAATEASGHLAYSFHDGEQRFSGDARNARGLPLAADVEATIRAQVLDIVRLHLRLGPGSADARGRIELADARSLSLSGSFRDFDLSQLVQDIDTRLNGTLDVEGRLREPQDGHARFVLSDSLIAGRPITGRGTIAVVNRQLDADVELHSGDARLVAIGGIGPGRELRIDLAAPQIEALMPGYGGSVDARITIAGEWDTARVEGSASAANLQLPGGQRVESVVATFRGGVPPSEPLAISARLAGHTGPAGAERSLAEATLSVRGTTSNADLEFNGMTAAQQPVRIVAQGGWRARAWRGSLLAAEVGAPLDLLMSKPAPVTISAGEISFGPAEFRLHGTRFSAVEVTGSEGHWRSVGRFEDLQPQALDAQARAPRRVVRSDAGDRVPLTLAGRWELDYADGVSGIAVIERTGGDLYSGIDALSPIGVRDVGAALNVLDNRITGNVYVRGRALGSIDAAIDAEIDPSLPGGRLLAQDRPFSVVVDANIPDLSWVGPLIGDNVQFAGRASVNARIGGTPANPTSTGTVRGNALRLAWVEQAVRLENGRLDAALEDGVFVINELVFAGTPRVAPGDRRALEGLVSGKPFEVRAVGRIALRSLTGSVGLKATQLPVLQRSDRWMVVSGDAGITLSPERADLYAKLTVDGAYINFNELRGGRSLPNDVVVKRAGTRRQATTRAPLDVILDVQGNLGERFYIEGAGLEARLAGAVNVSGRPSQLRGEGSVRAVDGVYAGYGQRLQIERGIVTFQGPVDNPALNVLAVRSGLPVQVGVAISGTAQRPFVRLYSDPSMSDSEKLNWLVLGRPPGASDGNDRALLSAAASALFAGQADSASANLMRSLGIDQITVQPGQSSGSLLPQETVAGRLRSGGVATSNSAAANFLAVGKRINDDLYLSFEQALSGAEYFVALNYRLTRQLSLIARAGSTNALDLVYSIAFD